jgi:hypothetical protein
MKKIFVAFILLLSIGIGSLSTITYADMSEVVSLVPKMTNNTSPSGEAFSSSSIGGEAYMLFDQVNSGFDYDWATSNSLPAYVGYDFNENVVVTKYTLNPTNHSTYVNGIPRDWIFQAWDGSQWIDLDRQQSQTDWKQGEVREYSISNEKAYSKYRLYITADNGRTGGYTCIGEMQLLGYDKPIDPVDPQPNGERAILVITMMNGLEREYDLSMEEVNAFINWYDAKDAGSGPSKYAIDKHNNNKGPFSKRTEYVIFNNILTFEVSEYSISTTLTY